MRLLFYLILIVLYASPAYTAGEPQIDVQLSHTEFPLHQGSLLSVTIIGDRNPKVTLPEIDGIDFKARGKSSQMSFINGSMTSSLSLQYIVTASREGVYSLDGITAEVDGQIYRAKPLSFTVQDTSIPKNEGGDKDGEKLAFIETIVKSPVYLGENIPVKIDVFFSGKQRIEINSSPQILGEDINMKPFSQNPQQTQEERESTLYDKVTWATDLSSVSSGTFPLIFQLDASILKREAQRSALGGFNDPFFSSMLSTTTRTPLRVMSKDKEITILPLPTINQPDNFSGAVGQFNLKVESGTKKADIGEPVQITLTLAGKGNFDLVHPPQIVENSQWKNYPAQKLESQQTHQKIFQQVIIAKESGELNLPQYSFSYFDPEKKSYVTLLSKKTTIHIIRGKSLPTITPEPPTENIVKQEPQESRSINLVEQHLTIGKLQKDITPIFFKQWFLIVFLILLLSLFYCLLQYIRSKKREQNASYYYQLNLYRELKQESTAIQAYICKNDCKAAQDSLVSLMQKYFAFHLHKEAHSISPYSLRSLENKDDLVHIFTKLSSISYAEGSLSSGELGEMLTVINKRLEVDS